MKALLYDELVPWYRLLDPVDDHRDEAAVYDQALQCLEWVWDPDTSGAVCHAEFAFLLRTGEKVEAVHDSHRVGLFPRDTWIRVLGDVGYSVACVHRPLDELDEPGPYCDEVFVCRRSASGGS